MRRSQKRTGFTLVELLVVILILAVLMALTASAVFKFLGLGPDAKNRNDIKQLENAMQMAKTDFNGYPPSRLKICKWSKFYNADGTVAVDYYPQRNQSGTLDFYSVQFLSRGKFSGTSRLWDNPPNPQNPQQAYNQGIQWSNLTVSNGQAWNGGPVVLEGDQVLVFALGGIPTQQQQGNLFVCNGFSADSSNPGNLNNPGKPYFQFQPERLVQRNPAVPFLSYLDQYADPTNPADINRVYAYFSCYNGAGYNVLYAKSDPYSAQGLSDCNGLGVWPWASSLTGRPIYQKPDTFQILSAGRDGQWGTGSALPLGAGAPLWSQGNGGALPKAAQDDWSNFSDGILSGG